MRANWQFFLLALLMACSLWFMVSGREEVEAWAKMRIEMKGMPANLIVMQGLEPTVDVRVRAPKGLLRGITDRQLAYSLDLSTLTPGLNIIPVQPEKVPLGSAYEVVEVRPSRLTLNVDSIETREVPVSVQVTGSPSTDIKVTGTTASPGAVSVRGPSSLLSDVEGVKVVATVPDATDPGVVEVPGIVNVPEGLEAIPPSVQVAFVLSLKTVRREVVRTVEITAPESLAVKAKTRKVTLQLELPESRSGDAELLESVQAALEVPENLEPGTHSLPYRVHLPEGVWMRSATPSTLSVTIRER